MVSLLRAGGREHVCTGVLVGPRHVVTPGHCVDPHSPYSAGKLPIVAIGGTGSDGEEAGSEVLVASNSVIHPEWESSKKDQRSPYNVAILTLPRPSQAAHPHMLFDHFNLRSGQKIVALGWGSGPGGPQLGQEIFGSLKMEAHEFIEGQHCNRSTLWNGELQEGTCCGLNNDRSASCMVDSGSPLVLLDSPGYDIMTGTPSLDFVTALNTDGAPCGMAAKPDIFVPFSHHRQWIVEVMGLAD
ncbi:unnamed protein product [Ostreobium quekettii]|uniref:Peptidase S1 domain-containing protein n=1 Tax=Ostreobium quekettii TaxID=121088 RepID=A0A8S1J7N2_9CHLO|nr:unnamed protein product [Ostreobium quekettii]